MPVLSTVVADDLIVIVPVASIVIPGHFQRIIAGYILRKVCFITVRLIARNSQISLALDLISFIAGVNLNVRFPFTTT